MDPAPVAAPFQPLRVINVHDPAIAGLVLTSSVVRYATPGAVPRQDLKAITLPVLVYHAKDACKHCQASEAPNIIKGLSNFTHQS